jgi:hypothetical protein
MYASAQALDLLDLAENCSFMNWKLHSAKNGFVDGHYLTFAEKFGQVLTKYAMQ